MWERYPFTFKAVCPSDKIKDFEKELKDNFDLNKNHYEIKDLKNGKSKLLFSSIRKIGDVKLYNDGESPFSEKELEKFGMTNEDISFEAEIPSWVEIY